MKPGFCPFPPEKYPTTEPPRRRSAPTATADALDAKKEDIAILNDL